MKACIIKPYIDNFDVSQNEKERLNNIHNSVIKDFMNNAYFSIKENLIFPKRMFKNRAMEELNSINLKYKNNVAKLTSKGNVIVNVRPFIQENVKPLDNILSDFLNHFNFDIQEYDDIKKTLGYDSTQMVDFISKFVAIQKGEPLTKSVAYIAYKLLRKDNSKLRTELNLHIKAWDKYDERFKHHKEIISKEKGYIDDKQKWAGIIRERVIVDYLADTIVEYYNNPSVFEQITNRKWSKDDFTLFEKFKKYIKKLINTILIEPNYNEKELINTSLNIVSEIINQEYDIYDFKLDDNQLLKNYQETINSDEIAKNIVTKSQQMGLVLTGSLALRYAGKVYRTKEESLHDLDFVVPFNKTNNTTNKDLLNELLRIGKEYKKANQEQNEEDKYRLKNEAFNNIEKLDWYQQFKKEFPSYRELVGFYGKDHSEGQSFTLSGVIGGKFYEEDGTHLEDNKKVNHKKGDYIKETGHIIDFFIRLNNSQEEHENYFKLWKEIMIAKLVMGRKKDLTDYIAFVPFIKSKDSYNFYYSDWVYANKEAASKHSLVLKSQKSNEIPQKTIYSSIKDINNFIDNIENSSTSLRTTVYRSDKIGLEKIEYKESFKGRYDSDGNKIYEFKVGSGIYLYGDINDANNNRGINHQKTYTTSLDTSKLVTFDTISDYAALNDKNRLYLERNEQDEFTKTLQANGWVIYIKENNEYIAGEGKVMIINEETSFYTYPQLYSIGDYESYKEYRKENNYEIGSKEDVENFQSFLDINNLDDKNKIKCI